MDFQTMYRIIVKRGMMTVLSSVAMLLFSMSTLAMMVKPSTVSDNMTVIAHVLAHPPVTEDCTSCHPDVRTMPRIN